MNGHRVTHFLRNSVALEYIMIASSSYSDAEVISQGQRVPDLGIMYSTQESEVVKERMLS